MPENKETQKCPYARTQVAKDGSDCPSCRYVAKPNIEGCKAYNLNRVEVAVASRL